MDKYKNNKCCLENCNNDCNVRHKYCEIKRKIYRLWTMIKFQCYSFRG